MLLNDVPLIYLCSDDSAYKARNNIRYDVFILIGTPYSLIFLHVCFRWNISVCMRACLWSKIHSVQQYPGCTFYSSHIAGHKRSPEAGLRVAGGRFLPIGLYRPVLKIPDFSCGELRQGVGQTWIQEDVMVYRLKSYRCEVYTCGPYTQRSKLLAYRCN